MVMQSHMSVGKLMLFHLDALLAVFLEQFQFKASMASSADGIDRSHLTPFCLAMEAMDEVSASGSDAVDSPEDPLEPIQNAVDSTRQRLDVLEDEIKSIKRLIRGLNRRMMAETRNVRPIELP